MKVQVRVIKVEGEAALVQTSDYKRVIIPVAELDADDQVQQYKLKAGMPYGMNWEKLLGANPVAHLIAAQLRARELYTPQDVLSAKPTTIMAALQAAYAVDKETIVQLARQELG